MCVKIITQEREISYDMDKPLEPQLKDASQVVISYDSTDPSIGKFLSEIERCTLAGISLDLNLKVLHNNTISGAKTKRQAKKAMQQVVLNDIVKAFADAHAETDKRLQELADYCLNKEESVR